MAKHIRLTDRRIQMIVNAYSMWALDTNQFAALGFASVTSELPPSLSRCQETLKRLTAAGYFLRIEQTGRFSEGKLPYVYCTSRKGTAFVAELTGEPTLPHRGKPRQLFLPHLLKINDVRIAIIRAARQFHLSPPVWHDELTLRGFMQDELITISAPSGGKKTVSLVPDGHCRLDGKSAFLVEADLGTEQLTQTAYSLTTWKSKMSAYIAYVSSGAYTRHFASNQVRVLTVTTTPARCASLKTATEEVGGRSLFWFTTFSAIQAPGAIITSPCWQVAGSQGTHRLLDPDPSVVYYEKPQL